MATVVDVSSILGEYMLKGWVLTDNICAKCHKVPLMRSPSGRTVHFCANCDGGPVPSTSNSTPQEHPPPISTPHSAASSLDFSSHASRPSTPPTEVSVSHSALSSPTFAPPPNIEEITRRRQQSDTASTEIGKRLLKGWTMLADECPNHQCYGIPLVRPPKSGADKDPRKECVVCHQVYVDQVDENGVGCLVLFDSNSQERTLLASGPLPPQNTSVHADKGKGLALLPATEIHATHQTPSTSTVSTSQPVLKAQVQLPSLVTPNNFQATMEALERSLHSLTVRLDFLSGGSSGYNVDAILIGQTADAISKVSQALAQVKHLQLGGNSLSDHKP